MKRIFLSYATADRGFASAVHKHLSLYYDVFLDTVDIKGGAAWEALLQRSIRDSDVVIAITSPASASSTWVARELLLSESLQKPCVPLLLEGDLPFRLLHLQYVDFRESFEPALAELLESLQAHARPESRSQHDATLLLGSAVRARLGGDIQTADDFVARAMVYDSSLQISPRSVWQALVDAEATRKPMPRPSYLFIVERAVQLDESIYENRPTFRWSVQIDGPKGSLDSLAYVEYGLHPTFRPKTQVVRARDSGFRLIQVGWGQFELSVSLVFLTGERLEVRYMLTFAHENTTRVPLIGG